MVTIAAPSDPPRAASTKAAAKVGPAQGAQAKASTTPVAA
jgi:hypothetical protein